MNKPMPSEVIKEFLDLLDSVPAEYEEADRNVRKYNEKTYTWTHDLEDAKDKSERNRLATAWQRELKERRKEKDRMSLYWKLYEFMRSEQNKPTLKRLRRLLEEQTRNEEYISTPMEEREYKRAVRNE